MATTHRTSRRLLNNYQLFSLRILLHTVDRFLLLLWSSDEQKIFWLGVDDWEFGGSYGRQENGVVAFVIIFIVLCWAFNCCAVGIIDRASETRAASRKN